MKTPTPSQLFQATALLLAIGVLPSVLTAQDAKPANEEVSAVAWTTTDTKLANHYIRLLEKEPAYGKVLDLLWKLYEKQDQTPLLLQYFEQAARETPQQGVPVAKLIHAHLLRKSGNLDDARNIYGEVLDQVPENIPAMQALAEIADRQERFGKALSLYNRLTDRVPIETEEGVAIRLRQADLNQQQSQTESAVATWNALLQAYPNRVELRTRIVSLLLESGETKVATGVLTRLAESDEPTQRLGALIELNRIYEFVSNFDGAVTTAREGLAILHFKSHDYADLFSHLVQIHERFDHLPDLEDSLKAEVSNTNPTENSLSDLAEFYRLIANPVAEEAVVSQLSERLPNDTTYRIRLARIQMRNDQFEQAAATLETILSKSDQPPLSLILLRAEIALNADNRLEAQETLSRYLDLVSDDETVRTIIEFARKNYLDELVERLLREQPPTSVNQSAPIDLARFLNERGRTRQAAESLWNYVDGANPNRTEKASRLHQVSIAFRELDRHEEALKAIESAIILTPEESTLLETRADLLVDADRIEEAIDQLGDLRGRKETLREKTEIDQRLFSLLRGHYSTETEPEEDLSVLKNGNIQTLAQYKKMAVIVSKAQRPGEDPTPPELLNFFEDIKKQANDSPSLTSRYRAAWWAFKLQENRDCFEQLNKANEEAGGPVMEVETMLLNLAELNERPELMVKHLSTLAEIDPDHADDYLQRRAEMRFNLGFEDEAVRELKLLAAKPEASLSTLNTLATVYSRQGNAGKQVEVWRQSYRQANVLEKRRIIKQLSTALIENNQPEEALAAQLELLEQESDVIQRRKQLDAQLNLARSHFLLDWLLDQYRALNQQHPFDRFYPEALARVYLTSGETGAAFEAMKKAYYMSDQNDALLDELGQMADELGDLKSAIYYRRQLLMRGDGDRLENWQDLIGMLEKDLRTEEADLLRHRLESRFGRDPEFLGQLTDHYQKNGQLAAAERTLEKTVTLRQWDLKARFQLALTQQHRGKRLEALANYRQILAETEDVDYPKNFSGRALPLIRVSQLPKDSITQSGNELDSLIFAVEEFPFLGGSIQDDIAKALQASHPEFHALPKNAPWIRLRAIEEAAALSSETGQIESWINQWEGHQGPVFERLWAFRYAGKHSEVARKLFVGLLDSAIADGFLKTYCQILSGDIEGLRNWLANSEVPVSRTEKSSWIDMAALIILTDPLASPLCDEQLVVDSLTLVPPKRDTGRHLIEQLRETPHFETTYRVASTIAETMTANDGASLYTLSQIAGRAGYPKDRIKWLDRSLLAFELGNSNRTRDQFLIALTERLSLMNSDEEKADLRNHLLEEAASSDRAGETERNERILLIHLAGRQFDQAIHRLGVIARRQEDFIRPRNPDQDEIRYQQIQSWQRMDQFLRFYADRIPMDRKTGKAFILAFGGSALPAPIDNTVTAQYEQFEVDRLTLPLEWLNAPERTATVNEIQTHLIDPDSQFELGKIIEAHGFHREAAMVYRAQALVKGSDYAPIQGLFEACAEALDPQPALKIIDRMNSREHPAPPGLTSEYLTEQHARFLRINRDIERLIPLSRQPTGSPGAPPITTKTHLPYQQSLITAYWESGNDSALLRLLTHLKNSDTIGKSQLLLGAEILIRQNRPEDALTWLGEITLNEADPGVERRAMLRAAELHQAPPRNDAESIIALGRISIDQQPPATTRQLAWMAHQVGASREASSLLRLLRRKSSDPQQRFASSFLLLRIGHESGSNWIHFADEWESLLHDFEYEAKFQSPGLEAEAPNASLLVEWLISSATAIDALSPVLETTPAPPTSIWLRNLILAFCRDQPNSGALTLYSNSDSQIRELILETLPSFGEDGIAIARQIVENSRLPGSRVFPNEPARQIVFYDAIDDHPRLLEVHSGLMKEAESDLFHQTGLESFYANLVSRRTLPRLLYSLGHTDLAERLYRRYHESIGMYRWNHQAFLEDYANFLIDSENYEEAEDLIHRAFQKSLRVDLRLVMQLYDAWDKLDEWEERTAELHLTRGRLALLHDWRTALAEGREMVDYRTPW